MAKVIIDGYEVLVDDEDLYLFEKFSFKIHKNRGEPAYLSTTVMLHRLIMDAPKGLVVDHLNHDGLDNRKSNLRITTNEKNVRRRISAWQRRSKLKTHLTQHAPNLETHAVQKSLFSADNDIATSDESKPHDNERTECKRYDIDL